MFLRVCSKTQLWVYHERSKKKKLKSFFLAFATEYWEWSIWSPFEQTDFFSVRHAVVRFIYPNSCPTEKEWFVKPISCDVKKSSRERLSLVFGYTASIWIKKRKPQELKNNANRDHPLRELSSLCRCVELFKLSAFCRATVWPSDRAYDYELRITINYCIELISWCKAALGSGYWENAVHRTAL